jgi:hypothetical protein
VTKAFLSTAKQWWKRVPGLGKVGLVSGAVAVLCCGGLTTIAAIIGPTTPKPASAVDAAPISSPTSSSSTSGSEASDPPAPSTPATTAAAAAPSPTPAIETRTVTETQRIPYATRRVNDSSLPKGTTRVRTAGVNGVKTLTYAVTLTNGVQTSKMLLNQRVTKQPVTQVVAVGTKVTQKCDPNYTWACVPVASDVDCAGGSGNGPAYVQGPVKVIGTDIYGLDNDGDGIGCEN